PFWSWKTPVEVNAPTSLLKDPSGRSVSSPGYPTAPPYAKPDQTPARVGISACLIGTTVPGAMLAHPKPTTATATARSPTGNVRRVFMLPLPFPALPNGARPLRTVEGIRPRFRRVKAAGVRPSPDGAGQGRSERPSAGRSAPTT